MLHATVDLYRLILGGMLPPRTLARTLHRHLLESCPACAEEWKAARAMVNSEEGSPTGAELEAVEEAVPFSSGARRVDQAAQRIRAARHVAQIDLWRLLKLPRERREERIVNARTRYRSRAFAELLIEHCRERVRSAPREAAELLELVPLTLLWTPGGLAGSWAEALRVRADAHRANALRVAGDLAGAEALFAEVRRRLARAPLTESTIYGEVASLEASLRVAQARYEEAASLLDQAVALQQEANQSEALARALIKRASVARHLEHSDAALEDLARARALVDPQRNPFLYLCSVIGEVPILIDREQFEEAGRTLTSAEDAFEAANERWWELRFRYLQGRVEFGLGNLQRAERLLGDARSGFLEAGLPQDTANASLDLALVHLAQGRTADVRRLTSEIAPVFRSLGVPRDAMAALALFQRATAADASALALVAQLRRHLETAAAGGELAASLAPPASRADGG